ncbi:amidohydrolase [Bordetella bronchiseptica]|uniref:amidohydrolase n=1 Tax=Bordetella bronchiseptica TaxID=518 RepID=UPI000444BA95|nr:amidohydrolase [Bordetella bronchiseptica]AWP83722.1 amidohydrolase [Bordetella bronchiseptica]AWQ09290.1 amidohydrolase [Bordetella bronchiseptica]AXT90332.1 amidohydrolase [Bordetella bronchiseptica]KDB81627.1 amidohydrolase family protein [Bordetella bronchiseptica CARE970018BB]KDC98187.1 amidohydrolase family protein [Bordetella bronchiseptica MBORD670]
MIRSRLLPAAALALLTGCASQLPPADSTAMADAIWFGGPIVTIDAHTPSARAVAVRDGRIMAVGREHAVLRYRGPDTRMHDLRGATLLPGFVDAHSHVSTVGMQALSANLLPPPDGPNASIADLQNTLRQFRRNSDLPRQFGMLLGFGYDDSQLQERRHPNRDDLDAVARDLPVVAIHQSGHVGVLNSAALAAAGIGAASRAPDGGVIGRRKGSREPDGVLEENAFFAALARLFPHLTPEQAVAMLDAGQQLYIRNGYTTIQDGRAAPDQVRIAELAARQGKLVADVVAYPDILAPGTPALMQAPWFRPAGEPVRYQRRFRIGGVKLTLDGSPQAKTAWLSEPYFVPPPGQNRKYAGYGVVSDARAAQLYGLALANRWQILTHANGDRAIDQMIAALRQAEQAHPGVDVRPVLIHGQTLRQDQIPALKSLGVLASLFPMHTYYWGDWHRDSVLGPQRAENISPMRWVTDAGMPVTSHHDAPVAFPDSMRVLSATVNRITRSGHVLGPHQRLDPLTALKSMTLWAAYQHFEEDDKGSITRGKLADFVVLSGNPLEVPPATLAGLKVLQTVKEGRVIFDRASAVGTPAPSPLGRRSAPRPPA